MPNSGVRCVRLNTQHVPSLVGPRKGEGDCRVMGTFAMKRPAAAASRKHVRKGTLKKPAAAPVAYDVQIAARGERLDRGEVPQDQGDHPQAGALL